MLIDKVESAFHQIEAGLVQEGLDQLKKLLLHPEMDDDLLFDVAQYYYQFGFLDEAIAILEELHTRYTDEAEVILFLAELYIEQGQGDMALGLLANITPEQEDDYLRAILLTSELFLVEGLFEVAENKIKQALNIYPDEQVLHTALGEVFYQQEKYSLAVLSYEKGSVISSYAKLADCYAHLGEFEKALDYYTKAVTTDQEDPELLFGFGFVAYRLEDFELAIKKLKALLQLDPFYTTAYPLLAEVLSKTGKFDEALRYVDEGIKYDQTNPYLFYLKGQFLRQSGDIQGSLNVLQKALEIDDTHTPALEELLELALLSEDWDTALNYTDKLLDVAPERIDIYLQRGHIYEELEQWKEAELTYRQALELDPQSTEALNQLAFLLRDEGHIDEALACWQQSLQIDPEQDDIADLMEQYVN